MTFETVEAASIVHTPATPGRKGSAPRDPRRHVGLRNIIVRDHPNGNSAKAATTHWRKAARAAGVEVVYTWALLNDGRYVVIANPDFGGAS